MDKGGYSIQIGGKMNKQDVMRGWVYVITNQAMPDIVKIGYSSKDPSQRTLDLNHTGAPHPYTLEFDALVINPVQIEQKIQKSLHSCREGKEWFRCSVLDAIYTIRKIAGKSLIIENDKTGKLRLEAARQEAARQKAPRQETMWQEAEWQEAVRQESAKQEPEWKEAEWQESGRQEAKWRESARREEPKNQYISVKKFTFNCINCKQSYDVTLNRYEDITVCPNCRSPQKFGIPWDSLNK
jgi:T5orf172 domain